MLGQLQRMVIGTRPTHQNCSYVNLFHLFLYWGFLGRHGKGTAAAMKKCYLPKIKEVDLPITNHPTKTHHSSFFTLNLTPCILHSQSSTLHSSLCILPLSALQQKSEFDLEETLLVIASSDLMSTMYIVLVHTCSKL